jgi:hypothetical protein
MIRLFYSLFSQQKIANAGNDAAPHCQQKLQQSGSGTLLAPIVSRHLCK